MSAETAHTTFFGNIEAYDVHVYYDNDNPGEKQFALDLHESFKTELADLVAKGDIRLLKFIDHSVGPHPTGMFKVDLRTTEAFVRAVPFFQISHGNLSVLIHPISDQGDLADHTKHALWLGEKQPLLLHVLK
ncbi:hypothetical protein BABINDRAFT_36763 [Babjeviella inositovora NRRL Y-12698]|uniref:DOPA 4,5-dioxygenase n=1 Tax=Babjeviella inositovora NRRL Y-12698 TaxID=984486 RepID=A0A1E3QR81_9ASCO|nr:uncharacterized protein BABINDRAFT_36763 [Babjeviella inositovora NRRL Y-12698]ODQ79994.1 hypothetical protein BABINDRAFT_36763 [Babjeviella inositovora NRRL Y-12698]